MLAPPLIMSNAIASGGIWPKRCRRSGTVAMVLLALGLAGCGDNASQAASERLVNAASEPENWLTHGGTYDEQRFSKLAAIDSGNVGKLGLAWYHDLDTTRGQEATPLVVDGVLYTTTSWSKVVALDAETGRELWKFDPKVPGETGFKACCDVVNRGAAFYDGKIYFGTLDGRLIALDAASGKELWSTVTVDQSKSYTITGAPRIAKGKVIIGNSGGELGVRGYVTAYDAQTGAKAWRFYTVPGDPSKGADGEVSDAVLKAKAASTWHGKFWEAGAGGTVWDSIVYDAEFDQVLIGVGNGSPWNHQIRSQGKGDNLFLSSIVALDAETGKYKWHYQETPGDTWDFTATQQMTLATLKIAGTPRKVIMQAPKSGFFYVVDRSNGKLISAEKYVPVNWASHIDMKTGRPVENPAARYTKAPFLSFPGAAGAHSWHPMSFSPKTGLVYIPVSELPMVYVTDQKYRIRPGSFNVAVDLNSSPLPKTREEFATVAGMLKGRLVAWNPVTQKQAWSVEHGGPWNGGTVATAGDLVFQGTARGQFNAYHAATGKLLWTFAAQTGVIAGPISYKVKNEQYIAVMAGYGGGVPLMMPEFGGPRPQPPGRVLVFKLGGKAALPVHTAVLAPVNVPTQVWSAAAVKQGEAIYGSNCATCHGLGTYSAGVLPDLKRSAALSEAATWQAIVHDGLLKDNGMVSFAKILSAEEIEHVRAFVASKAREVPTREASANKGRAPAGHLAHDPDAR